MPKKKLEFAEECNVQGPTARRRLMEIRQEKFLKAYIAAGYNVSEACKKSGINRHSVLDWKKDDPEFANKMWEIEESIADFVETQMLKQIRHNNPAMIMWFLETKGKNRGYTRRFEMENNLKIELTTEQIDAMVRAHTLATKDDTGKLKMPLRLDMGKVKNETDGDNGNGIVDAEYRETGKGNGSGDSKTTGPGESGPETAGSEIPGS